MTEPVTSQRERGLARMRNPYGVAEPVISCVVSTIALSLSEGAKKRRVILGKINAFRKKV